MVSISIMVIIMGVVLARHDSFNGVVLLRGEAYEIALSLREIQQSAVSASSRDNTTSGVADEFRTVLGAHFDVDNPNQYTVFQDQDGDNYFDTGEQQGRQGSIDPRFEIRAIRAGSTNLDNVSIVYERPNFDARFFRGSGNQVNVPTLEIDIARVGTTGSGTDELRTLEITNAGQIAVQ